MIVRLTRSVSLSVVWILVGICFIVPLVRSQQAADRAKTAAAVATAQQHAQAQQIARLSRLIATECLKSTTGAVLRNAMIDTMTHHLTPGIVPPAETAIRNAQYDRQRRYLHDLGAKIPVIAC